MQRPPTPEVKISLSKERPSEGVRVGVPPLRKPKTLTGQCEKVADAVKESSIFFLSNENIGRSEEKVVRVPLLRK